MAIKVAINGMGRIGRSFLKLALTRPELEVVAVNDLGDIANIAYLLKYDSAHGRYEKEVSVVNSVLVVGGRSIQFVSEKDPLKLPWGKLGVDIVVESTGVFTSYEKSKVHLEAGAKRVVITAPVKDDPPAGIRGMTALVGINDEGLADIDISSNASCTTNAGSPVVAILHEAVGIEYALLNTTHAYTASQSIVDAPNKKDWREGRAAAMNIVPSSTGAAVAVTKALPDLVGKFDGISLRVPVVTGSIADITFLAKRETSVEEINGLLEKAAQESRWKGVFTASNEELVSTDIRGLPFASIADLKMTRVVGGRLVKVLAWYDNEMGYTYTLVEHVVRSGKYIRK
jgi:glyceraldehyde 3-phosphate dehydrogenase